MNMGEKQILTSVIEIQKENWGLTTHFSKIINHQYFPASRGLLSFAFAGLTTSGEETSAMGRNSLC